MKFVITWKSRVSDDAEDNIESGKLEAVLAANAKFSAFVEYEVIPVVDIAAAAAAWQEAQDFLG